MRRGILALLLWALAGCAAAASQASWITFPDENRGQGISLEEWLGRHPMKAGEQVSIQEISRGETSSTHIVQVRKEEPLHIHETHDALMVLLKGNGTLTLGTRALDLKPGAIVTIPRSVPHSFVNKSSEPAVAYVVFTPPFDGKDRVPIEIKKP